MRFGRWDDILAEPATNYHRLHAIFASIHHAARAIAYAAKGDVAAARKEQTTYLELAKLVPKDEVFWQQYRLKPFWGSSRLWRRARS